MLDLTFGEQVKIILSRKGMTIKELAEVIEERTGKKMSRQNLTQRLGRDNFQEQDMRMIAEILECPFQLSILADSEAVERASNIDDVMPTEKELAKLARAKERKERKAKEKELTVGDYLEIHEQLEKRETGQLPSAEQIEAAAAASEPTAEVKEEIKEELPAEEPQAEAVEQEELHTEPAAEMVQEEVQVQPEPEVAESIQEVVYEEPAAEEEIYEQPAAVEAVQEIYEEEVQPEPAAEEPVQEVVQPEPQPEQKKARGGWRSMFQRKPKKEHHEVQPEPVVEEPVQEAVYEEPQTTEEVYIEPEEPAVEEPVQNNQRFQWTGQMPTQEQLEAEYERYSEEDEAEDLTKGELNPYTQHEYESNSVRVHPKRIGYVQVYDRREHAWTDMTEWAFLGYQERKKALLGKDYEEPIYLD